MFRASVFGAGLLACLGLSAGMMQRQVVDCPARLLEEGYKFEQVSGYDVGRCSIDEPIKLYSTPTTELHQPVTLSCSFAYAFGKWTKDVGAKTMTHMGG